MIITQHAIERFRERVTDISCSAMQGFIRQDIANSTLLYRVNNIEKYLSNGIIYVIERLKDSRIKIITLYLKSGF